LTSVSLPPKKGRANLTAIGLPKKKKYIAGLIKFLEKATEERHRQILGWMLSNHLVEKALHGERLECNDLDKDLHFKPNLSDKNIKWVSGQWFFIGSAWNIISDAMVNLENDPKWNRYICSRDLSLSASVWFVSLA